MEALFIGHAYIDVTFLADALPQGDEKSVATDYAVAFGGNATTAAFCCAKLGVIPDLITTNFERLARPHVSRHGGEVRHLGASAKGQAFLALLHHAEGRPARHRSRPRRRLPAPLPPPQSRRLPGAASRRPPCRCRALLCEGVPQARPSVSLDGGGLRSNTEELLDFVDVAVVAERLCEQMNLSEEEMLDYLKRKGCKIAGVTQGERGMLWYDESGRVQRMPALACRRTAWSTPTAPATSSMAPTCIPI